MWNYIKSASSYAWETVKGVWDTLILNARDIIITLLLIVGVLFSVNLVAAFSEKVGLDLSDTKDFIFALGKFAAVCLCGVGYLTHVTFRQSLGKFDAKGYMEAWKALPPDKQLDYFIKTCWVGLGAGAVIFAIGV